jgi:hypothetical protein
LHGDLGNLRVGNPLAAGGVAISYLHEFAAADFIGGDAALDFVNTLTGRDQTPRDWLDSYARLLEWAKLAALLPDKQVRALARMAEDQPAAATRALTRTKQLREQMFSVVSRVARVSAGRARVVFARGSLTHL